MEWTSIKEKNKTKQKKSAQLRSPRNCQTEYIAPQYCQIKTFLKKNAAIAINLCTSVH